MTFRLLAAVAMVGVTTQAGFGQKKPKKPPAPTPEPTALAPATPITLKPLEIPPNDTPPPLIPAPPRFDAKAETTDTILKRLVAIRAERDALAKEEASLKDRLAIRLKEQGELMRSLGLDSPTAAAPGSKPALYFPTTVGTERVFLVGGREVRDVVTAVERDGDSLVVTLAKPDQPGGDVRVLAVSPDEVLIRRNGDYHYQSPHVVLRPRAGVGATWNLFGTDGGGEVHRLIGAEDVTVPAGTFKTLRVDYGTESAGKFEAVGSLWYAPGVGSIRNSRGGKDVLLLKSFKPGDGKVSSELK